MANGVNRSWPRRWSRRLVGLLALALLAAAVSACGGIYAIPDSQEPVVFGISMLSSSDGWAVGAENHYRTHGMIAHYQNGSWMPFSLPANAPALYSVSMLSASDGWAVGFQGAIYHYQNGNWSPVSSPATATLHSIVMLSPEEGWAVGADILHYQQGVWTLVQVQVTQLDLQSLVMLSAQEGWAVGRSGQILHYTGGQWQLVTPPQTVAGLFLTGVAFTSPEEGWAVGGNGIILHYHAGVWSNDSLTTSNVNFSALALVSPTEGWAVGTDYNNDALTGAIFHYTQGKWAQIKSPTHSAWYALAMISADEGWTGGTQGTLLEYANGEWC
jgi:photosystem II stability/assembly factor-like uncharacterized protein